MPAEVTCNSLRDGPVHPSRNQSHLAGNHHNPGHQIAERQKRPVTAARVSVIQPVTSPG